MAASVGSIVWGVQDVRRAVDFWSAALDYRPRDAVDDDWVVLVPRSGDGVQLAVSRVEHGPSGHRRHHLDLYVSDQDAEVRRLVSLGARPAEWRYEEGADYVVLTDPDGNLFCVVQKN